MASKQHQNQKHPRQTVSKERVTAIKAPLTIAEIIKKDNIAASKPIPTATRARLSQHKIVFSSAGRLWNKAPKIPRPQMTDDGSISLTLPSSVIIGQPGKEGSRIPAKSVASMRSDTKLESKPFKPDWAPFIFHPKLGARIRRKPLHRFNGRRVVPLNQEFIYGTDDRHVFNPSGYPWQCIGRVDVFPDASSDFPTSAGSGALIGDRIVLTAGHVAPRNVKPGQWKMRFTAGLFNGSPVNGPGAISFVSDFLAVDSDVSGEDYAVLRLFEPLGVDFGSFGWKSYDSSWDGGAYWFLAGYPFDIGGAQSPSFQSGIAVLDEDPDLEGGMEIEHHGDVASGDSGGPFWGFWDDGPYIVGTTSGHEHVDGPSWAGGEDNNIAAGGDLLGSLIQAARNSWPA